MSTEHLVIPEASSIRSLKQFLKLASFKLSEQIRGHLYLYDQDKIDYEMTFWEQTSYLGHYLGRRRRGLEPRVAPSHELSQWFLALFMFPLFRLIMPFALLCGMQSAFSLPRLTTDDRNPSIQKVKPTKRQAKSLVSGTIYGMEKAAMLCQCDGHRLFLFGNTPLKLVQFGVTILLFFIGLLSLLVMNLSNQVSLQIGLGLLILLVLAHLPIRHGVLFDRDAQTAMLIRGWFRKPLVVPFDGIFFTSYTEDVRNFSKDLIVHSQYVPKGRKKPIRLALNTTLGSTGYSMAQVVGAVDCFMDKNNTQAMPLSIKHSIEWHRKHKLTLWHLAWRPLPEDELRKYTAADSLYQADLLDPKDKAFKFQLTSEGREVMRKEDLLNRYLKAVWEAMSVDAIDAELKQAAEAEFGAESLEAELRKQAYSERCQTLFLVNDLRKANDLNHRMLSELDDLIYDLSLKENKENLNFVFEVLTDINNRKKDLLGSNLITYDQYKKSFKNSKPTSQSELVHTNIIQMDSSCEAS
ncbi:hypothetical protein [Reinekea blandensis]|uniref:Uncharacterized protein n=1 Tax=Reinekea blandensis MED297 TaxID=314283 RepID=A4BA84_9GAMM|nr:hypothetical protein [Reinekea blandensis]EAR10840.1 hypothetical protein MED297_10031 [Reinekea sp. MED297] [Reinekea blandensis MED297]